MHRRAEGLSVRLGSRAAKRKYCDCGLQCVVTKVLHENRAAKYSSLRVKLAQENPIGVKFCAIFTKKELEEML